MLILDEPTSGVDPVARDSFWELLIGLSRKQGVTIFITTHFMNEGMRCDRISLMNAGKVLAADAPQKLIEARGAKTLEEAFIGYMEDAIGVSEAAAPGEEKISAGAPPAVAAPAHAERSDLALRLGRLLAYSANETMQILAGPGPPGFRLPGLCASDARLRVRHHNGRRTYPLCRLRPRPDREESRLS